MMTNKTILLLGGYGITGRLIARLLLEQIDIHLVLAGRSRAKAEAAAAELNQVFPGERVSGVAADASDPASMKKALQGADFLLVASSTSQYVRQVSTAALEAGVDYLDIQYSTKKIAALKSMEAEIEKAGLCFITDGGFHPGLPAALIRYAAGCFDTLEKANVGSVIKIDWNTLPVTDATIDELVEEFNDFQMLVYKDGRWKKASMTSTRDFLTMDFGSQFGRQYGAPMFLEELRALPGAYPSLKETGFYVGSFNWFVDWLIMPIGMLALKLWPQRAIHPVGKLMVWGLKAFSKPPYGTLLKVEAQGIKGGQQLAVDVTVSHPDGYVFTAIPVVACLIQYLDGSIRQPGLWTQANIVEPARLMRDMQHMGVEVKVVEHGR
jgi:saccharopine dehydrogenase (NAD+, L-lysine-forming)